MTEPSQWARIDHTAVGLPHPSVYVCSHDLVRSAERLGFATVGATLRGAGIPMARDLAVDVTDVDKPVLVSMTLAPGQDRSAPTLAVESMEEVASGAIAADAPTGWQKEIYALGFLIVLIGERSVGSLRSNEALAFTPESHIALVRAVAPPGP